MFRAIAFLLTIFSFSLMAFAPEQMQHMQQMQQMAQSSDKELNEINQKHCQKGVKEACLYTDCMVKKKKQACKKMKSMGESNQANVMQEFNKQLTPKQRKKLADVKKKCKGKSEMMCMPYLIKIQKFVKIAQKKQMETVQKSCAKGSKKSCYHVDILSYQSKKTKMMAEALRKIKENFKMP